MLSDGQRLNFSDTNECKQLYPKALVVNRPPMTHEPLESLLVEAKDNSQAAARAAEESLNGKSALDLRASKFPILNIKDSTLLSDTHSLRSEADEQSSKLNMSTTTNSSSRSNGELNTLFKFGGKLKPSPAASEKKKEKTLTLSDIIPPLSHARSPSESSLLGEEENSVLKSIYAKVKTGGAQSRSRLSSNASAKRRSRFSTRSFLPQSRPSSMLSFTGLDSFDELWRNF
jgi:serine/arginine repetitive matrix protein 2